MLPVDALSVVNAATSALAGAGLTGAGFWTWLRYRPRAQASLAVAQVAFQEALNGQSQAFTASLMDLTADQRRIIDRCEERIGALEADNLRCHQENRNLRQTLASLITLLRKSGIDIPQGLQVSAILELSTEDGGGEMIAFTGIPRKATP